MASIIIADDHPIVVEGIVSIINQMPEHNIIAICNSGHALLNFLQSEMCDLLMLDINLPDMSGLDLCLDLKKQNPSLIIMAISSHSEPSIIARMMDNGADGYLLKNSSAQEIKNAIAALLGGTKYLSNEAENALQSFHSKSMLEIPKITRREKEIILLIGAGKTTIEIADELFISTHTVETHRKNLMEKFQVKSTAAVVKLATDFKII